MARMPPGHGQALETDQANLFCHIHSCVSRLAVTLLRLCLHHWCIPHPLPPHTLGPNVQGDSH